MTSEQNEPAVLGPVQRQVRPGSEARWYSVSTDGRATLCADADGATAEVARDTADWPLHAPYTAVQLVDAAQLDAALTAKLEAEALEMSHGEVIERLRAENATFRNAQRACEHCDPASHAAAVAAERERLREDHAPLASAARDALDLLERIEIADGGKYGDLREVVSGLLCILGPNV